MSQNCSVKKAIMYDSRIDNIPELKQFLVSIQNIDIQLVLVEDKYTFISGTLRKFKFHTLSKKDKGIVLAYLKRFTGYKKTQLHHLIKLARKGNLKQKSYVRHNPNKKYTAFDIKLLEKTDEVHLRLNSVATKAIFKREFNLFGNTDYENISKVSHSHINNLRKSNAYTTTWVNGTNPTEVKIGVTRKPEPNGKPGSIRIDTVHQRDIYHINAVDEVTQWEVVASTPKISEAFLEPVLYDMLRMFPFVVFNFHSDKGSEFVNYVIAEMLNKLMVIQTKSRSRHSNDNALVECKNGCVVRKHLGFYHIDQNMADKYNDFNLDYLTPYLNYHRPCLYITKMKTDSKGKKTPIYGQCITPYEKLKEVVENIRLKTSGNVLREDVTFGKIDKIAYAHSDNEFAKLVRQEREKLFNYNRNYSLRK